MRQTSLEKELELVFGARAIEFKEREYAEDIQLGAQIDDIINPKTEKERV